LYKENSLTTDSTLSSALGQNDSETLHQFLKALGNAIDAKDAGTGSHSGQVGQIAEALGWAMGLSGQEVRWLHIAGHLHDIGKIGIPDTILAKSGPLNAEEWELIFKHPAKGDAIVRPVAEFAKPGSVADMVLCHHERYDGQGYPAKLKGKNIPLGARIISVADTLSTMMQDRPYRPGRSFAEAADEIIKCSGTAYDPNVVETFLTVRDDIEHVMTGNIDSSSNSEGKE
jgi:HD-GYP domain-containing protein (c-di-GMP phosphodiesterase class II)